MSRTGRSQQCSSVESGLGEVKENLHRHSIEVHIARFPGSTDDGLLLGVVVYSTDDVPLAVRICLPRAQGPMDLIQLQVSGESVIR